MRTVDLIQKKRDGYALTKEEIEFFVRGVTDGSIPDYQISAMLMAIYFCGMNEDETAYLTYAIRDSGDRIDLSDIEGIKADKHSSGGVGDKTTLVVAPLVAACGLKVAKMSGRGLGHTGGTVDKLESIAGFRTSLQVDEFRRIVRKIGVCVVGQSANLAPADKKLYALRDVTATVDKLPLIVSSIMGKKLASGADVIVLDVKTGSGSFMKSIDQANELARQMVAIGRRAGKRTTAVISNMDVPLGSAIGNSLEVVEAIRTLQGKGPQDLVELSLALATAMLTQAGKGTKEQCRLLAQETLASGKALATFRAMVQAQGGDPRYIDDPTLFASAAYCRDVVAKESGYIAQVNTARYGHASLLLGAGRATKEDAIDFAAGIMLHKKTGDFVQAGEAFATLYTNKTDALDEAGEVLQEATAWSQQPVDTPKVILGEV